MKQRIKLTEGDLHRIVKESVKRVLNEIGNTANGQYMLGRLQARQQYRRGQTTGENDGYGYLCGGENDKATSDYALKQRAGKEYGSVGNPYLCSHNCAGYNDESDRLQRMHGLKK